MTTSFHFHTSIFLARHIFTLTACGLLSSFNSDHLLETFMFSGQMTSFHSGIPEVRHKTLHTLQNTTRNRPIAMGLDIYDKPIPELITLMSICNKAQIEITGTTVPTISSRFFV